MRPQAWHLIVLLVVILLVFGASKLPDITRNVGRSMKIFKEEVRDLRDDSTTVRDAVDPNPTLTSSADTTVDTTASDAQRGVTPPGGGAPSDVPPQPGR
ncbi:MAG TPA: twin-arginine translocase TatA/TatE family subunit [Actinotalea caeni]|uniref:twin-arginine translocase TatA/TatE family subunit n=1 Tax=Actinotalea caeni TaxID=1348467 RepID=UPI0012E217C1|nr:twin-arginine translocase TatA/TatE family subunit [Actinotalea caeni]HLV54866.1 twin-arginine translocase TatA/TatE family subunit [Actinotalea caeni]